MGRGRRDKVAVDLHAALAVLGCVCVCVEDLVVIILLCLLPLVLAVWVPFLAVSRKVASRAASSCDSLSW